MTAEGEEVFHLSVPDLGGLVPGSGEEGAGRGDEEGGDGEGVGLHVADRVVRARVVGADVAVLRPGED